MPTRIFKSGNSLSVRIPKEMVPDDLPQDAEIEYKDGAWTIRPVHGRKLTGLGAKFRAFSPEFMAQGREAAPEVDREWPDQPAKAPHQRKRKA
ncbi:MAG: AbrB/MazE/SpoVT family DNA-binding domain-containing protein [Ramlibacter sp.]|nr:AbrB/MazE/SpoVT family DNA-binding domain-containing protein [Ramlibacter sp.]